MAKFAIPKITRPLRLSAYAPELDTEIHVWVNPPRAMLERYEESFQKVRALSARIQDGKLSKEEGEEIAKQLEEEGSYQVEFFSELWSQHKDPETHWSAEEVTQLIQGVRETDPMLFVWMTNQSVGLIVEHRTITKKG